MSAHSKCTYAEPLVPLPVTLAVTVALFTAEPLGVTVGCEILTLPGSMPTGITTTGVSTMTVVLAVPEVAPDAALAVNVTVELVADELTMPERLQAHDEDCAPTRFAGVAVQPLTKMPAGKPCALHVRPFTVPPELAIPNETDESG